MADKLTNLGNHVPSSAQNAIFRTATSQDKSEGNSSKSSSSKDDSDGGKNIQLKDFFWDQFLIFLATAIALLTFLDVSVQFLRSSGGIQCYVPSELMAEETTRDQAAYVNTFCQQFLSWNEYYSVFILVQGIILVAPHYLWTSIFTGRFDFFVDLVRQLDRLRDSNTGEYRPRNFDIVKKLEQEFPEQWKWSGIFTLYISKLGAQLVVILTAIFVNIGVFQRSGFRFTFNCPSNYNTSERRTVGWSLSTSVECVYPSFRVLSNIQIVDYLLLIGALGTTLYGLFWSMKRHPSGLGYKKVARFAFASCLSPNEYVSCSFWKKPFSPRIMNDLDFLLMRLFRADSGHGRVFKDIQVYKELNRLLSKDKERLLLYRNVGKDNERRSSYHKKKNTEQGARLAEDEVDGGPRRTDLQKIFYYHGLSTEDPEIVAREELGREKLGNSPQSDEVIPGIQSQIFYFFKIGPNVSQLAHDMSFGNIGFTLLMARAYKEVIGVDFNPYYRNEQEVCKKCRFQSNFTTIIYQDNIYAQETEKLNASDTAMDDEMVDLQARLERRPEDWKTIDFTIVGPFTNEAKKTTANLHIDRLNNAYFTGDAALMAIRPLMIGGKDVSDRFWRYEPPTDIFELNKKAHETLERDKKDLIVTVKDSKGLRFHCDEIECVFEFAVYKYVGKHHLKDSDHTPPPPPSPGDLEDDDERQDPLMQFSPDSLQPPLISPSGLPLPPGPPPGFRLLLPPGGPGQLLNQPRRKNTNAERNGQTNDGQLVRGSPKISNIEVHASITNSSNESVLNSREELKPGPNSNSDESSQAYHSVDNLSLHSAVI